MSNTIITIEKYKKVNKWKPKTCTYIGFFWFTANYYSSANAEDDKKFFQTKKYFPSSFFWLATSDENYEWNCPMDGYLNSHSPVVVGIMSV